MPATSRAKPVSKPAKAVRHYRYSGNQDGWWVAFLDEKGFICVQSDWGDYGYCWNARGDGVSMREWLAGPMSKDRAYVTGKLAGGKKEIDEEATMLAIRQEIAESGKSDSWKEEEEDLLRAVDFSDPDSIREWHDESSLVDRHSLLRYQAPQQLLMFMEKVWPHICDAARADLEANP